MTFGERLRDLRKEKGLSQTELAGVMGVTQGAVGHWENDLYCPQFKDVQKLCKALGVKCTAFDGCEFPAKPEEKPARRAKKKS